uniref:C2H2-type domain-containing protein n=1 Tax=Balaenoptera musculus TaxID=9771 RepID=A0A8C0CWT5_BALMU
MSSSGVGGEASVTLTLADTQGLLSGGLDTVTLNIASQGQQFPALLTDPALSGPGGAGSPQVILVSPTPQPSAACEEITYQVTGVSPNLAQGGQPEKEGRLHQCLECGRTFASAALLLHHSKELPGRERIHVCPVCRKAFKRATHLKEHMQTHQAGPSLSSQKPRVFRCDTCEKAFAKPSQLERHSRIHTGERPFHCTLCEKAFNQKSALQVHMKKHTGERPYRCNYCVMGFTQKSNMKLHMKRAHSYAGTLQEARRRPGARRGGAEPCSPPGRGGARTCERVADPGQRVLTQPDPEDVSRAKCGEEQSTWDFCFEASSVKNVTTIAIKFLAIKLSKESLTFRDFRKKAGKDGSTLLSFICKSLNSGNSLVSSMVPR